MNVQSKIVVTAAEFTRQFGQLRHTLGEAPVHVTHHGRETHVLLSRARYETLRAIVNADAGASPLPELGALADWLPSAVMVVNADEVVDFANAPAHAMLALPAGQLTDRRLTEAVPALAGTLLEGYLRRALTSGEVHVADLPSPVRDGAWWRLEIRPSALRATILLHDITEDVVHHRLADRSHAVARAVAAHAAIGEVRVSPRGFIEAVDAATCGWLALPEERLLGVAFADLIPAAGRVAVRERIDQVLRGGEPAAIRCDVLTNGGTLLAMDGIIVELRGAYGSEGAIILLTEARGG